jgi:5'-nucleotidase
MWILHEWWPREMLEDELAKRNLKHLTQHTVDKAMQVCSKIVCVCEAQKAIYRISCPARAIYVGVPAPSSSAREKCLARKSAGRPVRFLTLGIVCPRKNQREAVRLFRKFAGDRTDVTLDIVGARYVRDYEREYCAQVVEEIGGDERVKLHPVTDDPGSWYARSDVLLFLSVNEVTPLVLAEAALHRVPSITYDIGGISEMITPDTGFLLEEGEETGVLEACQKLADSAELRRSMGVAAEIHAERFTTAFMVREYEKEAMALSPTVVLLDMDGVLVDWDAGFRAEWQKFGHKDSDIDRTTSYFMEDCVAPELRGAALAVINQPHFFRDLPPMPGAVEAVREMLEAGFDLYICTSPLDTNPTCCQDKLEWVRKYLGDLMPMTKVVMSRDKTLMIGDVLIDDKPEVKGKMSGVWEHIIFDAPYNKEVQGDRLRMDTWTEWRRVLAQLISPMNPTRDRLLTSDSRDGSMADGLSSLGKKGRTSSGIFQFPAKDCAKIITAKEVQQLRDFSSELPNLGEARRSYLRWRKGGSQGMEGNVDSKELMAAMLTKLENAQSAKQFLETDDNVDDIYVMRKQFRAQYAQWRQGKSKGVDNRLQKLVATKNGTPSGTPRLGAAQDPQVPSPTNLGLGNFMPTTRGA